MYTFKLFDVITNVEFKIARRENNRLKSTMAILYTQVNGDDKKMSGEL